MSDLQKAFEDGIDLGLKLARLCAADAADYEQGCGAPSAATALRNLTTVLENAPFTGYPRYQQ
ncbi:hypothetical protein IQ261_04150 [Mycobacteroides abscessus subsp. massiliense]|uniref:hypothetical protein n=1 Tax=Mycobacteroides abscessus TaxID=36809 RepID=UPI0019256A60|nr:hypothetical protein [Mycobacteroides abscessus]MBL3743432.1 hypothetical protein [Mycobacteroides abscessus subsp. massiliense]